MNVTWSHGKFQHNEPLKLNGGGSWALTVTLGHNITALFYSIQINDTSGNFHRWAKRTIPVLDNDLPHISGDNSPNSGTTGDGYTFDIAVFDNINVSSVNITWSHSDLHDNDALTDDGDGTWSLTVILDDSLQKLIYSLQVNDSSSNIHRGPVKNVSVIDNDLPVFGTDGTPSSATTGDPIVFKIAMSDNIAISQVFAEYWYGEAVVTNPAKLNMSGTGPYIGQITAANTLQVLNYRFTAKDTSGNARTTTRAEVGMVDDDVPVIGTDGTPGSISLTGSLVFSVEISDNIAIRNATVEYWYGNDTDHLTAVLIPDVENSIIKISKSLIVDEGATSHLYYRFRAVDSSGNEFTTGIGMINITELHIDTDGDGMIDYRDNDDDNDNMPDDWEIMYGLNPLNASDAENDDDGDGLSNFREWELGIKPNTNDTDNDGMPDGWEVNNSLDPKTNDAGSDRDGDNLPNMDEYRLGTNPMNEDSDGDGVSDGEEVAKGSDPRDSRSKPEKEEDDVLFSILGFGIGYMDILGAVGSVLSFILGFLLLTRKRRLYKRYLVKMDKIEDWDELKEFYRSDILPRIEKEKFTPHHSVLLKDAYDECRAVLQKDSDRRESLKNYRKALRKALSDGVISDDEGSMLEDLRETLGITDEEHEKMLDKLGGSGRVEDAGLVAEWGDDEGEEDEDEDEDEEEEEEEEEDESDGLEDIVTMAEWGGENESDGKEIETDAENSTGPIDDGEIDLDDIGLMDDDTTDESVAGVDGRDKEEMDAQGSNSTIDDGGLDLDDICLMNDDASDESVAGVDGWDEEEADAEGGRGPEDGWAIDLDDLGLPDGKAPGEGAALPEGSSTTGSEDDGGSDGSEEKGMNAGSSSDPVDGIDIDLDDIGLGDIDLGDIGPWDDDVSDKSAVGAEEQTEKEMDAEEPLPPPPV